MSAGRRPSAAGAARPASRPRVGSRPAPVSPRAPSGVGSAKTVSAKAAGGKTTGAKTARARAGRGGRGAARPVRARRVAVLGGVLCVLAVLLAPALRAYLAQQQQVAALRAEVTGQRLQVQELSQESAMWKDDAFVMAQARERLKFVKPGERVLTVIDPPASAKKPASTDPRRQAEQQARPDRAWFSDVWNSVGAAGRSQAGP